MDCSEVRSALLAHRDLSSPQLEAHVADCSACGELLTEDAALGRVLAVAGHAMPRVAEGQLAARVARDLQSDRGLLGRLRALGTGQRIALAVAVAFLPVFVLSIDNPRALSPDRVVTVVYALMVAAATASLLAPLTKVRRRARQALLAAFVFGVPTALLILIARRDAPATYETLHCFAIGMLSTAPSFATLHMLARRPRFSLAELALLCAITGVSANMTLGMYCTDTRFVHLLAGHAIAGLVWMACSAYVSRRLGHPF